MALIEKQELLAALRRLGELAVLQGKSVELLMLGGGVMVIAFDARLATRDVDVVIISPSEHSKVFDYPSLLRKSVDGARIGLMKAQRDMSWGQSQQNSVVCPGDHRRDAGGGTTTCDEVVCLAR